MNPCRKCNGTNRYADGRCRSCVSRRGRKYRDSHREQLAVSDASYYLTHKDKRAVYLVQNVEAVSASKAAWRRNNREKVNSDKRNRYESDVEFRLGTVLRNRLGRAIRRGSRSGSAVRDLGCSIVDLKVFLEQKFRPGMTWENYGQWHIDHVKPLAKFDLTDRTQLLQACHYTNLQPLWAEENLKKSDRG